MKDEKTFGIPREITREMALKHLPKFMQRKYKNNVIQSINFYKHGIKKMKGLQQDIKTGKSPIYAGIVEGHFLFPPYLTKIRKKRERYEIRLKEDQNLLKKLEMMGL